MSFQATVKTEFTDEATLVEALEELMGKGSVTVHAEGQTVQGYRSGHKPTIVIKKSGLYGTPGYFKNAHGKYELVYDSMDLNRLSDLTGTTIKGKAANKLAQTYARIRVTKELKKANRSLVSQTKTADGSIRLRVRVHQW